MSRSLKIIFLFLAGALFLSENTGKAFLYGCCLLLNDFDRKISILPISIVSVIFDIYHSLFIGISLVSVLVVAAMVKKFESVLVNLHIWARLYYFLMIVSGAELIICIFTTLTGGRFDAYAHMIVIVKSIFFCYIIENLKDHAKRS